MPLLVLDDEATLRVETAVDESRGAELHLGDSFSLMAGEVASLLLSRMTVPVVHFLMTRRELRRKAALGPIV